MSDERLRELYREGAEGAPTHLDEALWERLASGEAGENERADALDHVARCPECAAIYRVLVELEREVRDRGLRPPGTGTAWTTVKRGSRTVWLGLAAAAAIVLLFSLMLWRSPPPLPAPDGMQLRAESVLERPEPLRPIGPLPQPPRSFSWQGLGEGWSYRVQLLDAGAEPLWESPPIRRSAVDWPATVPVEKGAEFYWRVLADPVGGGPRVESRLVSFSLP